MFCRGVLENAPLVARYALALTHRKVTALKKRSIYPVGLLGWDVPVDMEQLGAANAVRLLGAQAMLAGIRSEVAQTLVQLGIDLGSLVIRSTLQSGVAYALGLAGSSASRQRMIDRKLGN